MGATAIVEHLREEIRRRFPHAMLSRGLHVVPAPEEGPLHVPGETLEARLGWPVPPGTSLLLQGQGATTVACRFIAVLQRRLRQRVAFVDGPGTFYPPTAAGMGVDLDGLLWLHCPVAARAVRATELLVASGRFGLVVLDQPSGSTSPIARRRLQANLMRSSTRLLVVSASPEAERLRVDRQVQCREALPRWFDDAGHGGIAGWDLALATAVPSADTPRTIRLRARTVAE